MEKRVDRVIILIGFIILLLANAFIVKGEVDTSAIGDDAEKILDTTTKLKEFTEKNKWEFLGEQWKEFLLKNAFIAGVDSFFKKIDIAFVIILAESYDLSIKFFIIFLMWLFVLLISFFLIKDFLFFKKGTGFLISLGIVVVFGHIGVYSIFSDLILNLLFYKEGIWRWISWFIFIIMYIFIILYIKTIVRGMGEGHKKKLEQNKQESLEEKVAKTSAYVEGMRSISG